jgi:hypothetical protein
MLQNLSLTGKGKIDLPDHSVKNAGAKASVRPRRDHGLLIFTAAAIAAD